MKTQQINKLDQIQDKAYSYNVIGYFLSSLECYANKFSTNSKPNIFSAYNNFDCGNKKNKTELKHQIISQLELLKASLTIYITKFGEFEFPSKMSKEQMIETIEQWKEKVPDEDKKYYDTGINILKCEQANSFVDELGSSSNVNPNFIKNSIGIFAESNQMGKNAIEDYKSKGVQPDLVLHSEQIGNDDINKRGKDEHKRREQIKELDNILDILDTLLSDIYIEQNKEQKKGLLKTYKKHANDFIQKCEEFKKCNTFYWYKDNQKRHKDFITNINKNLTTVFLDPPLNKIIELLDEKEGDFK
jgi:hypothetical protein